MARGKKRIRFYAASGSLARFDEGGPAGAIVSPTLGNSLPGGGVDMAVLGLGQDEHLRQRLQMSENAEGIACCLGGGAGLGASYVITVPQAESNTDVADSCRAFVQQAMLTACKNDLSCLALPLPPHCCGAMSTSEVVSLVCSVVVTNAYPALKKVYLVAADGVTLSGLDEGFRQYAARQAYNSSVQYSGTFIISGKAPKTKPQSQIGSAGVKRKTAGIPKHKNKTKQVAP